MKLEDIQKVIGTPEENQQILIKALLLDLKFKCSDCGMEYITGEAINNLFINILRPPTTSQPNKLLCQFRCACGRHGEHTFDPNPFISQKLSRLDRRALAVMRAKASGQTIEEYLSDKESSSDNYALEA